MRVPDLPSADAAEEEEDDEPTQWWQEGILSQETMLHEWLHPRGPGWENEMQLPLKFEPQAVARVLQPPEEPSPAISEISSFETEEEEESLESDSDEPPSPPPLPAELDARVYLKRLVGWGGFGEVYRVGEKYPSAIGEVKDYALKIIRKAPLDANSEKLIRNEVAILSEVKHENIVELIDRWETDEAIWLLTEYLYGGEILYQLAHELDDSDPDEDIEVYSEASAKEMIMQLLRAMDYLHSMGIVHRDIKPENCCLKYKKSQKKQRVIKLIDFGFACKWEEGVLMEQYVGTEMFVPPEILLNQPYEGPPVDMWAIGVLTYILLCGFPPFEHEKIPIQRRLITEGVLKFPAEHWQAISDMAKSFIRALLQTDPSQRLSAGEALLHPWMLSKSLSCTSIPLARNLRSSSLYMWHSGPQDLLRKASIPVNLLHGGGRLLEEPPAQRSYSLANSHNPELFHRYRVRRSFATAGNAEMFRRFRETKTPELSVSESEGDLSDSTAEEAEVIGDY